MPRQRRIAIACLFALALVLAPPWTAPVVEADLNLEHAWMFALAEAWRSPLVFGRDIIWTYGPWGFAFTPLAHPATFRIAVAVRALLAIVTLGAVYDLVRRRSSREWPAILIASLVALTFSQPDNGDLLCVYTVMLCAYYPFDALRRAAAEAGGGTISRVDRVEECISHALAFCAALAGMGKFIFFVAGGVAVIGASIACASARRRLAFIGATWLVATPLLWLAAGQPLGALADHLRWCVKIVNGYTEAMALPTPLAVLMPWVITQLGVIVLTGVALWPHRKSAWAWPAFAGAAATIFILTKGSLSRHAGTTIHLALPLLPLLLYLWLQERSRAARYGAIAMTVIACAAAHLTGVYDPEHEPMGLPSALTWRVLSPVQQMSGIADACSSGRGVEARQTQSLANLAATIQQPPIAGTVDQYRVDNHVPAALGLSYSPHPAMQSYQACTPDLEALNVAHLTGPRAPQWVLYRFSSIDHRFPTLDEPRVLMTLWSDYTALFQNTRNQVGLQRTPGANRITLGPPVSSDVSPGEWVAIPQPMDTQRVWARIRVSHSSLGKAAGLVYRYPRTMIEVRKADGTIEQYRLILAMAEAGFPLSPVTKDTLELFTIPRADWHTAMDGRLDAKRVIAFRVITEGGEASSWAYQPRVGVELSAMSFTTDASAK